jgi:hypothetical protein
VEDHFLEQPPHSAAQAQATIEQLTGIEACQCRRERIVRNHIACAFLVWIRLKHVAHQTQRTIYQVKHDLLSDYLRQQLRSPALRMSLA